MGALLSIISSCDILKQIALVLNKLGDEREREREHAGIHFVHLLMNDKLLSLSILKFKTPFQQQTSWDGVVSFGEMDYFQ